MDNEMKKLQEKILSDTSVPETVFSQQESQSPSTGDSNERWWIWICVGIFIIFSIINIWFAVMVSDNMFGKSRLIPYGMLFTMIYILFECFGILFISVISDLRTLYQLKKKKNCITNKTD